MQLMPATNNYLWGPDEMADVALRAWIRKFPNYYSMRQIRII